jgi:hypothetical protein
MDVDIRPLEDVTQPATAAEIVNQILREGAEHAARTIIALSTSASSESVRLKAAQYVVDRVCGGAADSNVDPWDVFLSDITGVSL